MGTVASEMRLTMSSVEDSRPPGVSNSIRQAGRSVLLGLGDTPVKVAHQRWIHCAINPQYIDHRPTILAADRRREAKERRQKEQCRNTNDPDCRHRDTPTRRLYARRATRHK